MGEIGVLGLTSEIRAISCFTGVARFKQDDRHKVPLQREKLTDDIMLKTPWGSCLRSVVNQLILGWMTEMGSWSSESPPSSSTGWSWYL